MARLVNRKAKHQAEAKQINDLLCLYYKRMGFNNYTNNFLRYIAFITNNRYGLIECDYWYTQLQHSHEATNCRFLDFDNEFPIQNNWNIFMKAYNINKKEIIFYILQFCYIHNNLPTSQQIENYIDSIKDNHTRNQNINQSKFLTLNNVISNNNLSHNNNQKLYVTTTSHSLSSCSALYRLLTAINYHKQNNQFINNFDKVYLLQILNDYFHLITQHNKDKDFQYIVNSFGCCDMKTCTIMYRIYRTRPIVGRNMKTDILDKIHCYYTHTHDIFSKVAIKPNSQQINSVLNDAFISHRMKLKYNSKNFQFGSAFSYGYNGEELSVGFIKMTNVYPKLSSLKEEMITKLTVEQFKNEYEKADQQ
eukprot:397726_1